VSTAPVSLGQEPALAPFRVLIGHWTTTATHGLLPDAIFHGRTSFEWVEGGAFLMMRSSIDDPRFPKGVAVIGSDDTEGMCYMLTFDERGVSRRYDMTLQDTTWKWWRNAPGFFQRYEAVIADDGNTIIGRGELSKDDGVSWEKDLDVTYRRVE
jgi:hypothetical protein